MKFFALGLILLVSACSHNSHFVDASNTEINSVLSGEVILGRPVALDELPELDLFKLTPAMKLFADEAVKSTNVSVRKTELLHKALLSSSTTGPKIRYSTFSTGTAQQVFESGEANCLGYTLLYVALAQHLGLNAHVNQVMVPPVWNMNDQKSYVLMRHVNAKVIIRKSRFSFITERSAVADVGDVVIDLEMGRYRVHYTQKIIDNAAVEALFYNNLAMELVAKGDVQNAFLYLRRAIKAQPDQSFIWSNLGSFYRKRGHLELAQTSYLHALSLNDKDLTVLHNLAGLYAQMGKLQESDFYTKKVAHYRNANPYYWYHLAVQEKQLGNIQNAKKYILRALKKENKDNRLYALSAELFEVGGEFNLAKQMREKAESLQ